MKLIKFLQILLAVFICIFFSIMSYLLAYNTQQKEYYNSEMIFTNNKAASDFILRTLSSLPESHRKILENSEWVIIVSNDGAFSGDLEQASGLCDCGTKSIWIRNQIDNNSILHEIGHAIDYELNCISETDEFISCFDAEKDRAREYAQQSSVEFFADLYRMYLLEPKYCKNTFPNSYQFLKDYVF